MKTLKNKNTRILSYLTLPTRSSAMPTGKKKPALNGGTVVTVGSYEVESIHQEYVDAI